MPTENLRWLPHDGSAKCPVAPGTIIYGISGLDLNRHIYKEPWQASAQIGFKHITEYAIAADEPDADGWIPTHGKRPDLPAGTLVETRVREGLHNLGNQPHAIEYPDRYNKLWWSEWITHYRLHDPQRQRNAAAKADPEWLPASTPPKVPGVYEIRGCGEDILRFRYCDGRDWYFPSSIKSIAFDLFAENRWKLPLENYGAEYLNSPWQPEQESNAVPKEVATVQRSGTGDIDPAPSGTAPQPNSKGGDANEPVPTPAAVVLGAGASSQNTPVFRIHRDRRFGLLVKYPSEPVCRLVGEIPFLALRRV